MTDSPIRSEELLDLAQSFVPEDAPPGRPRTVHLRRGVSLAYYALFHELVHQACVELCGMTPAQARQRRQASRWFAHTDIRALAEAANGLGGGTSRAVATVLGKPHQDLASVAQAFCALQNARNRADYDHDYDLVREHAVAMVRSAARAVSQLRRLRQTADPSFRLFLRLMTGAVKIARSRHP